MRLSDTICCSAPEDCEHMTTGSVEIPGWVIHDEQRAELSSRVSQDAKAAGWAERESGWICPACRARDDLMVAQVVEQIAAALDAAGQPFSARLVRDGRWR